VNTGEPCVDPEELGRSRFSVARTSLQEEKQAMQSGDSLGGERRGTRSPLQTESRWEVSGAERNARKLDVRNPFQKSV
jgi:hypothetical protein